MIAKSVFFCVATVLVMMIESRPVDEMNKSSLGSPFFDEIVVESTLTVRGKGGAARQSRGKKLQLAPVVEVANKTDDASPPSPPSAFTALSTDGASVTLKRNKRQGHGQGGRHRNNHFGGGRRGQNQFGVYPGQGFPSSSGASANAASQGFNVAGPNGFGASASNAGTQGFQFGPNGFSGSAGQAASQTYRLPNGNTLNVALSNGFNVGPNGGSQSASNAVSLTRPNGQQEFFRG